jgi:ElaB/YqjD/DUF883 family membrane-anchored ribosome-binding protein
VNDSAKQSLSENRKRLAQDFKAVIDDAEELLRHAARDAGEGYDEARARLEESLKAARAELGNLEEAVMDGARRAGRATEGYVREHPWESLGIAAGVGLVIGLLIARR